MKYLFQSISIALLIAAGSIVFIALTSNKGDMEYQHLKVTAIPLIGSSPLYIAIEKGYFKEEGLEVTFLPFQAAQHAAIAVASGDADIGVAGLTAGFYNLAKDGSLKMIGGQSQERHGTPGSMLLACNKAWEQGVTNVSDLPGHSFAITQAGSTFHYMVGQLAEQVPFNLQDVQLTPLHTLPNLIAALRSCQVDTAILPPQIASKLAEQNEAHIIMQVSELVPWQLGAIFARNQLITDHPETIKKFMKAWIRAAREYHHAFNQPDRHESPEASNLSQLISHYVKPEMSPEQIQRHAVYVDPEARLDIEDIYRQVSWYQKEGLVDKGVIPERFIASGIIGDKKHHNTESHPL